MSRFRGKPSVGDGIALPRETQHSLVDWFDGLARREDEPDPTRPALALFTIVLALLGFGLIMQVNHAATTQAVTFTVQRP